VKRLPLVLKSGDALVNAVTGERIVIRATAGETDGERFEAERLLLPERPPHPEHIHPRQETVITIVRGVCGLKLDGNVRVAFPGERVVVPAGRRTRSGTPAGTRSICTWKSDRASNRPSACS
jgi:quercetin dioxygenase-like cupin family protein